MGEDRLKKSSALFHLGRTWVEKLEAERIEEFYFPWRPHSRIGADPSPSLCSLIPKIWVWWPLTVKLSSVGPSWANPGKLMEPNPDPQSTSTMWPSPLSLAPCGLAWPKRHAPVTKGSDCYKGNTSELKSTDREKTGLDRSSCLRAQIVAELKFELTF